LFAGGRDRNDLKPKPALLQFQPEEIMLNLTKAVQQLKQERDQARNKLEQLDEALKILSGLTGAKRGLARSRGKRRTMSAAARKRIAAAQRARWAKWKAANRRK
jgi:hypothetical protein